METINQLMQERNRIKRVLGGMDVDSKGYANGVNRLKEIDQILKEASRIIEEVRKNP